MSDKPTHEIDGEKQWLKNGNFHRENGPAVERADGTKQWYLHGDRHREDGPAIEWAGGDKGWWLHGERVDPEQIVDLWLSRGVFCYYDKEADELRFDA
jgi:hypothetical protein